MNAFNSTLPNRKKPLKAKKGFKPRSQGFKKRPVNARGRPQKRFSSKKVSGQRKGLRKRSKKLQKRLATEYYPAARKFLRTPEARWCWICICTSLDIPLSQAKEILSLGIFEGDTVLALRGAILRESTETHHLRGRSGKLLSDPRFFCASCRGHRTWPHENPSEARRLGLLAEAKDWGVLPHEESTSI